MKRLAILTTHPIQYYAPVFSLLTQRGKVQVHVFYSKPREKVAYDINFKQVVEWDIPLTEGYDFTFQEGGDRAKNKALIKAIENWKPDALLVFGWNFPGHFQVMRYFKGKIPLWFRGDSTLLDEKPGFRRWARRNFLRWVYSYVDLAFYVGTRNKEYFLKHGLKEKQLRFAPHATDNERFADGFDKNFEVQAKVWRQELGIKPADFVVLFAGKIQFKKAPDLLMRAVQQINQLEEKKIHLIFAGSGEMEDELRKIAKNSCYVHFLGFQNQSRMPVVYRLGDVYCLPSRGPGETWGLAVNEALACGRKVIVSDKVGCAVDLIQKGINGYCFPYNDHQVLSHTISVASMDKEKEESQQIVQSINQWSFINQVKSFEATIYA